jgi:nitrite reductase/ring-hydroxylating ferredoxin subunit
MCKKRGAVMDVTFLKRSVFQRLFGRPATGEPADERCWTYVDNRIEIDLSLVPELAEKGQGIRLEGKNLPQRILVIHGEDGTYHAFENRCQHMGRRLDPVPGGETIQCCSVSKSTYDYNGNPLFGPAKKNVPTLDTRVDDGNLIITL